MRTALADATSSVRDLPEKWAPQTVSTPQGRDEIEAAARSALPKGLSKSLSWVAGAKLPELCWADGAVVPDVVWHWWVHLAVKARLVEPGVTLRTGAALLDRESRQVFAAALLRRYSGESRRSATTTKGILAVVAALGGSGVAGRVEKYLSAWPERTAQAKALIELLAWVDDPEAPGLLVSLERVLRPTKLVTHARQVADVLAKRQGLAGGWALEDRVVPDAGLDAHGQVRLGYGPRSFVLTLTDEMGWAVTDENNKTLRGLPSARSNDDPGQVAAAKALFARVKVAVKQVADIQVPRLRTHMASGRTWTVAEWDEFIGSHPIMSRFARRLVWTADPGGTFRPLPDGTFTDVHDRPFTIDPDAAVRLAHSTAMTSVQRKAWQEHLNDYEVTVLFDQLGTDPVTLDDPDSTALTLMRGYRVEQPVLTRQAARHGYRRDRSGSYTKEYPAAQIVAVLSHEWTHFATLHKGPRPVPLTDLSFRAVGQDEPLRLGDVPSALLAESWADMVAIAGFGTPPVPSGGAR
ncbi:MAG: DUF4132 domain-containing protein [Micrococcales bacterium]|nr:DUF4132 domain-containing protein [Micrococcales bacterium]